MDGSRADRPNANATPTPRDCERCLAEIATLYPGIEDPAEALAAMDPGDAEDALILTDAVADGRVASPDDPPTCATCGAVFGPR